MVNGKTVAFSGKTRPLCDTHETILNVNVANLDLPHYLEYLPVRRECEVPSAFFGPKGVVSYVACKDEPPVVRVEGEANIRVTDDDLRQLATERASQARDRLSGPGKVEPERVFLVAPKTLPPERKEKLGDSRVDFRVQ